MSEQKKLSARPELLLNQGGPLTKIQILFEDQHLLALSKPRAMHSVVLQEEDPITIADCLAAYCPETLTASEDRRESGLLQRLDYFTTGLMLAAKNNEIWQSMHKLFVQAEVEKSYLALVEGEPEVDEFVVDLPLVLKKDAKKIGVARGKKNKGRIVQAYTEVGVIASVEVEGIARGLSLVRARAEHTIRHQIRAHLAGIGFPLVGDELYGSTLRLAEVLGNVGLENAAEEGFLLHAESVSFDHPKSQKTTLIEAPLREPFEALLRVLEI